MKRIGIVGHAQEKFTRETERTARSIARGILLMNPNSVVSTGRCHLGGVDIYAEEIAMELGQYDPDHIFPAENHRWEPRGYKARNLKIARAEEVHVIVVEDYPEGYTGRRFKHCYHCQFSVVPRHVKSGGCWTARQALKLGKDAYWHIITPTGVVHYHERVT